MRPSVALEVQHPVGRAVLLGGFAFGVDARPVHRVRASTTSTSLSCVQTWRAFRGQPQTALRFVAGLYRVRPAMSRWLFAFWKTPTMTFDAPAFRGVTTAYILVFNSKMPGALIHYS